MKKILHALIFLSITTALNAVSLSISEVGSSKIVSQSCVNTTCTVTLSSGSQLYFKIKNTTSKNLILTKFEIVKTYNGTSVVESSTTDTSLLSGATFEPNEEVILGYENIYSQIANFWTAKYYFTDLETGQKYINSLKWNNSISTSSVVVENITENTINVSRSLSEQELQTS